MSPESITSGYNQPPDGDWVVNGNLNVQGAITQNGSPIGGGGSVDVSVNGGAANLYSVGILIGSFDGNDSDTSFPITVVAPTLVLAARLMRPTGDELLPSEAIESYGGTGTQVVFKFTDPPTTETFDYHIVYLIPA